MKENILKKKARYVVFEGTEGIGKTTQVKKLVQHLRSKGYKVLETKEPGTPHIPETIEMRKYVLDSQYAEVITPLARELITQVIRSIHMEKLIIPAMEEYDFIVQDRGMLSGMSYAAALGHDTRWLEEMMERVAESFIMKYIEECSAWRPLEGIYDDIILLKGNISQSLNRASSCKQEYKAGDFIEQQGTSLLNKVDHYMDTLSSCFGNQYVSKINVDDKNIEEVFESILSRLNLR
jgi:thymidylate kinase